MFVHAACERKDTRLVDQQIVSSKKSKKHTLKPLPLIDF
jgi:hypothetical protein